MSTQSKPKNGKTEAENRLTEAQRQHHIAVAAYYIAENEGFNGNGALANWLAAEAEIDRLLAEGKC